MWRAIFSWSQRPWKKHGLLVYEYSSSDHVSDCCPPGGTARVCTIKRVEQPEFSKEEGREGAPTSRDPEDDQLSEYDDDSSDNDSDELFKEKRSPFFPWSVKCLFIFRELWKERFIFRETWSRPPLYHPLHGTSFYERQDFSAGDGWRVAGGGWRVTGGGWRVTGGEWRVAGDG